MLCDAVVLSTTMSLDAHLGITVRKSKPPKYVAMARDAQARRGESAETVLEAERAFRAARESCVRSDASKVDFLIRTRRQGEDPTTSEVREVKALQSMTPEKIQEITTFLTSHADDAGTLYFHGDDTGVGAAFAPGQLVHLEHFTFAALEARLICCRDCGRSIGNPRAPATSWFTCRSRRFRSVADR